MVLQHSHRFKPPSWHLFLHRRRPLILARPSVAGRYVIGPAGPPIPASKSPSTPLPSQQRQHHCLIPSPAFAVLTADFIPYSQKVILENPYVRCGLTPPVNAYISAEGGSPTSPRPTREYVAASPYTLSLHSSRCVTCCVYAHPNL